VRKFRYRLQRVLDVKEIRERQQMERLATARRKADEERAALAAIEDARRRVERELLEKASAMQPHEFQSYHAYLTALARSVAERRTAIADADRAVVEEERRLAVAGRERKTLENARDRSRERHRLEVGRAEQGLLDEVAGRRHGSAGTREAA
jgi:flagellar FliJ protein